MRSRTILCLFMLSLLGACADAGCPAPRANALSACVGATVAAQAVAAQAVPTTATVNTAILDRGVGYTGFTAAERERSERIPVRIDVAFNAQERATIENAVAEWNHVLNGHVRLEIAEPFNAGPTPTPYVVKDPKTWFVGRVNGSGAGFDSGHGIKKGAFSRALAQTHELANGGQLVLVFSDRVGSRDLNGILLHEMGHALGLGHDAKGLLMHAHYASHKQQCIDRTAVHALAAQRRLPFDELNWCGKATEVNAAMAQAANRAKIFSAQAK
jgi:hypothetical protein